jgi:hypothetical protein
MQLYLSISPRSFKHGYTLQIESYQSFPGVPTRTSLAKVNLVIHLPAILSRMTLAKANLVIHLPAILSRMTLAEVNLVNTLDFIYIEHDIYCNCIHHKNFKLHKCKEEGNHALASLVLWPPPAEDTILVIPPESQRSLWSWSLQAECYKESIVIHCTYVTFYACSFPHHNIHTHIMYIFRVSISMCKCPQDSVLIYIYI